MKSKKKPSKKKSKSKIKKKAVKKTKITLNTTGLLTGITNAFPEERFEISQTTADWLANNPDKWDPEFTTDPCGCKQPERGCLDESDIHQDGICEDSDCKNEICLMERSLKAWEETKNESKEFVIKQEDFNRPFWDGDVKENTNKNFWQKLKQFFGFKA